MYDNKWIAHGRMSEENKINLLCFSYPGGSASNFATWKKLIDSRINLLPILYPERELRKNDPMEENFELFVDDFINENKELFSVPYAFFGYCGGAVLAYEISAKVKKVYDREPIAGFIASSESPEYLKGSILEFPAEGTREDVIEYLLRLEMFDEAIVKNKVFLDYYIPMLRADCNMLATYQYRSHERMSCDFDIWYGKEDKNIHREKIEKWRECTNGNVKIEKMAGGHFFVDIEKQCICEMINQKLLEVQ